MMPRDIPPAPGAPQEVPGMPPGVDNRPPQALTFALLEAQRSNCDCRPCQLLRKAITGLSDQILQEPPK